LSFFYKNFSPRIQKKRRKLKKSQRKMSKLSDLARELIDDAVDAHKNKKIKAKQQEMFDCANPGDLRHFYFVFPADSPSRGHLDINEAVRKDKGKTPVCLIYLRHMLGNERADVMMANPKIRDRHLTVVPMPNFQNTGFDTIVMRYTEIPSVSGIQQSLADLVTPAGVPLLLTSAAVGGGLISYNANKLKSAEHKTANAVGLLAGLAAIGIPIASFMSALKVTRNERDRLLELESRRMGTQFQQWQEIALSQTIPEIAPEMAAGRATPYRSRREEAIQTAEFRRVMEQSPEARVAGGADPRTSRTEKARWLKKEKSTARLGSRRKSAREGNSARRSRGASRPLVMYS
jgi:hypothetical protein